MKFILICTALAATTLAVCNGYAFGPPPSIDWRSKGAVSPVRDRGDHWNSQVFAVVDALESAHFLDEGKLVSLSQQNLIDCSGKQYVEGLMSFVRADQGGIMSSDWYPYEGDEGKCRFDKSLIASNIKTYTNLKSGDEEYMKKVVSYYGPVVVSIDATDEFFNYKSGVLVDSNCSPWPKALDYNVLVVGYGTNDEDGDYWIVKNSMGTQWGENGYIRMARNRDNMCGIATRAVLARMIRDW